ncbi:MAG: DUF402 domain-containing protein [Candidatus Dormibacteria bacterium]
MTDGVVLAYDTDHPQHGRIRHHVLLDESVQLTFEPWMGGDSAWYVDLVGVQQADGEVRITDMYVDVIVGRPGPSFRVIDLDDLAAAVETGALSLTDAISVLRRLQAFLDAHLQLTNDFPPAVLNRFMTIS